MLSQYTVQSNVLEQNISWPLELQNKVIKLLTCIENILDLFSFFILCCFNEHFITRRITVKWTPVTNVIMNFTVHSF